MSQLWTKPITKSGDPLCKATLNLIDSFDIVFKNGFPNIYIVFFCRSGLTYKQYQHEANDYCYETYKKLMNGICMLAGELHTLYCLGLHMFRKRQFLIDGYRLPKSRHELTTAWQHNTIDGKRD